MNELHLPANAIALFAALAVGLVIGLERGWRDRDVADGGRVAGLRTFALVGLLGGVFALSGPWLLAAGAVGLALLAGVSYREGVRATGNLSATSAVAQLLIFGLGALAAAGSPVLAVSAAVIAATLLDLRSTLHRWLRLIEHRELQAALQMLVLSAVVQPLLPDAAYGPHGALNPYRLWWAVVLIAGLSLSGHVAIRLMGPQRGTLWTGLLGGLASSTATTLALSRKLRQNPGMLEATAAGALSACAVMFVRITVVLFALAPALGLRLVAPLLTAGAMMLVFALVDWRRRRPQAGAETSSEMQPFDMGTALGFGAFLAAMSVFAEGAKAWLGAQGLYGLALLSGLMDVDAITISVARMDHAGSLAEPVAATTLALAVLSNMVTKAVLAWTTGGSALGRRIVAGYLGSAATGGLVLVLTAAAR